MYCTEHTLRDVLWHVFKYIRHVPNLRAMPSNTRDSFIFITTDVQHEGTDLLNFKKERRLLEPQAPSPLQHAEIFPNTGRSVTSNLNTV
jgi:hypothetical protein